MNKRPGRIVPTSLAVAVLLALSNIAAAQDANPPVLVDPASTSTELPRKARNLDAVVVTGTRAGNRTESSSLMPIDVISADVLK